eukprot:6180821-Pleurochrysis_carterae.AAC.1
MLSEKCTLSCLMMGRSHCSTTARDAFSFASISLSSTRLSLSLAARWPLPKSCRIEHGCMRRSKACITTGAMSTCSSPSEYVHARMRVVAETV